MALPADLAAIAYLPQQGSVPALMLARTGGALWGVLSPFRALPA